VVKFRNVEMGQVREVLLSEDMQSVTAVIKMDRKALPLLAEDTRFWVVTAQIGGGSISGLDTLLSGAYIQISPGESGSKSRDFVGLEEPPLTPLGAPGVRLILISEGTSSISSGNPVVYRGFKVGRVESLSFDPEAKRIRHVIFIDAPYDALINSSVRFWDVSGVSVSAGAEGFKVDTGSLETILRGGVTFGLPPGLEPGVRVENNTEFRLFQRYDDILESPHEQRGYYVVSFAQSVKGVLPGAPVEYRGVQIGEVERLMVEELVNTSIKDRIDVRGSPIPVLIFIEPARFAMPDTREAVEHMHSVFTASIKNGLRATIGSGSLITGAKVVELEFHKEAQAAEMGEFGGYPAIPTMVTGLSGLENQISALLDKANKLPLEQTVSSMNLAVAELNQSLKALRVVLENDSLSTIPVELQGTLEALRGILEDDQTREIPGEVQTTLEPLRRLLEDEGTRQISAELQGTLAAARFQLQGESAEVYQLGRTLKEVETAARALTEFLDALEKKPESLLRGKSDKEQ
jgi:paraquat-inducible protein B